MKNKYNNKFYDNIIHTKEKRLKYRKIDKKYQDEIDYCLNCTRPKCSSKCREYKRNGN